MNGYAHFQEFPKFAYNQAGESRLVKNREAEKALGDGWGFGPNGSKLPVREPQTAAEAEALEAQQLLKPLLETARLLMPDSSDFEAITRLNEFVHEQMAYGAASKSAAAGQKRSKAS